MSIARRAEVASELILVQINELDKIVEDASPSRDITTASERVERWKTRTVRILSEKVNPMESESLRDKRVTSYSFRNPLGYVTKEHKLYRAFLASLLEQLRNHPEELFQPSTSAGPISDSPRAPTPVRQGYVFIAMPMDEKDPGLEDVHATIKNVARKQGFQAERVDDLESNERITPRILKSLAEAQFVVADLTHSKPNVYFEAGYADALGTTPVYIAKKGTVIEFDVKDYPVIFFENITEMKRELARRFDALKLGPTREP